MQQKKAGGRTTSYDQRMPSAADAEVVVFLIGMPREPLEVTGPSTCAANLRSAEHLPEWSAFSQSIEATT